MLPARVRAPSGWTDACILNVSSRGLMVNANSAALRASSVEIWHQEHLIVATIVWRSGTRAGLRAESPIPVEQIMAGSREPSLQLTAQQPLAIERRRKPRSHDESRIRARLFEFAGVSVIAASLAIAAFAMIQEAFARPLHAVQAALGG